MSKLVIAASKPWFAAAEQSDAFKKLDITYIHDQDALSLQNLRSLSPRYVFFPHWHWKIAPEIYQNFECIVFHTAPLPYGRGGSPIQNLILEGFDRAPVCAIAVDEILDAGAVYAQKEISLQGRLSEIFAGIAEAIQSLIVEIVNHAPTPQPQSGEIVQFKRRTPEDSRLPQSGTLRDIYDRIRMLDAEGYPHAFIEYGPFRFEFSHAELTDNGLEIRAYCQRKQ